MIGKLISFAGSFRRLYLRDATRALLWGLLLMLPRGDRMWQEICLRPARKGGVCTRKVIFPARGRVLLRTRNRVATGTVAMRSAVCCWWIGCTYAWGRTGHVGCLFSVVLIVRLFLDSQFLEVTWLRLRTFCTTLVSFSASGL